ncbi:MAG TPA: tetratricopeptide repeat protein [Acidobacteriota bacterium]|nr:tetratricopeptide repeat protein [Acidobacteriota bacterium]
MIEENEIQPKEELLAWKRAGVAATLAIILSIPLYLGLKPFRKPHTSAPSAPLFVGSGACRECHAREFDAWKGSNHALAMLAPRPDTVRGDFNDAVFKDGDKTWQFFRKRVKYFVRTDDLAGTPSEFEIAYTFGWFPLQQYLVPFPGGRMQCLSVAWDVRENRWFTLYPGKQILPGDWLHWTRAAMNWNTMCSQCHSTGVQKRYDPEKETFRTTWAEISVGCEACHGPGSQHVEWARKPAMGRPQIPNAALTVKTSSMPQRDLVNLCAPCHIRRAELKDYGNPASEILDAYLPTLLTPGVFYADGQIQEEDYEVHSFMQSKMYEKGVKCNDCHDVHRARRYAEGNTLCLKCHRADTYDTPTHHFHKKIVDGRPSNGASCIECHMPGRNYMVIHFRRDHSLRIPRPDLTQTIDTPNACSQSGCHADKPLTWVIESFNRWYGTKRKPHYGTILAAARGGKPEARSDVLALASDPMRPAIVRATALALLWQYPGEDSTKVLEQALADPDALIRRTAVSEYRQQDRFRLVKVISPLLKDPVHGVRIEAAATLAPLPAGALTDAQRQALQPALKDYLASLSFSEDMPSGRYNLANYEQSRGNVAEAEKQYRKALEMDDQFYMAAVNLSLMLSRLGRNAEAEALLQQALRNNPHNATIAFDLGLLQAEMGKNAEAEDALRRALTEDPRMAAAAYNLAVLVGARDLHEAAKLCGQAASLQPDEPKYAYSLAYYQVQLGNEIGATATLEKLVQSHPDYADATLMLGDLYMKKNRVRDAASLYDSQLTRTDLPAPYRAELTRRRSSLPPTAP